MFFTFLTRKCHGSSASLHLFQSWNTVGYPHGAVDDTLHSRVGSHTTREGVGIKIVKIVFSAGNHPVKVSRVIPSSVIWLPDYNHELYYHALPFRCFSKHSKFRLFDVFQTKQISPFRCFSWEWKGVQPPPQLPQKGREHEGFIISFLLRALQMRVGAKLPEMLYF